MNMTSFIESKAEIEQLLTNEHIGFLGMSIDNKPYVIPINFVYTNGRIIFHCSHTGQKIEYLKINSQICLAIAKQFGEIVQHPQGAACHSDSNSVMCFGRARIIEDIKERRDVLNEFNHILQPQANDLKMDDVLKCLAVEIIISKMTAREERNSKCIYRIYDFENQNKQ